VHELVATLGTALESVDSITVASDGLIISDIVVLPSSGNVCAQFYDSTSNGSTTRLQLIDVATDTVLKTVTFSNSGIYRRPRLAVNAAGNLVSITYTSNGSSYDTYTRALSPSLDVLSDTSVNSQYGLGADSGYFTGLSGGLSYVEANYYGYQLIHPTAGPLTTDQPGTLNASTWLSASRCVVFSVENGSGYNDGWLAYYDYAAGVLTRTALVHTHITSGTLGWTNYLIALTTSPTVVLLITDSGVTRWDQYGGFINAVSPACVQWGEGNYYVASATGYDLYRPEDIDPPTASLAAHTGWSGLTLELDVTAAADGDSTLASLRLAWDDGATTTDTTGLADYADGEVVSHAYSASGLYKPVLTVADIYGLVARATMARTNVGSYVLASNLADFASGGTFTLSADNGGTTTITLNATARQAIQYALESAETLLIGLQFDAALEDESNAVLSGYPSLSLNSGAIVAQATPVGEYSGNGYSYGLWVGGTGVQDQETLTLGYDSYGNRTYRALVQFALPDTWALVTGATLTVVNSGTPSGTTLTGRVIVGPDNSPAAIGTDTVIYYTLGLDDVPTAPTATELTEWHELDEYTVPTDTSQGFTFTNPLDETAIAMLNYCQVNEVPFRLGLKLGADFELTPQITGYSCGPVFSSAILSTNDGEETINWVTSGMGIVNFSTPSTYGDSGTVSSELQMVVNEQSGSYSYWRWLGAFQPTTPILSAELALTFSYYYNTPTKAASVQIVILPLETYADDKARFRAIGNDCHWPSISPATGLSYSPVTVTITDDTGDDNMIKFSEDGVNFFTYAESLDLPGVRGTATFTAYCVDGDGRQSALRTSEIVYRPYPPSPQVILVL
jgi:hypothetical protein